MDAAERRALLASVQRSAEDEGWTRHVPSWTDRHRLADDRGPLSWRVGLVLPFALIFVAVAIEFGGRAEYFAQLPRLADSEAALTAFDERLTKDLLAILCFLFGILTLRYTDLRLRDLLDTPRRLLWRRRVRRMAAIVIDRTAAAESERADAHRHLLLLEDSAGASHEVTTNRRTRRKLPPGTAIYAFLHGPELLEYRRYRAQ